LKADIGQVNVFKSNATELSKELPKGPMSVSAPSQMRAARDPSLETRGVGYSPIPVDVSALAPSPSPASKPAPGAAPYVNNPVPALQVPAEAASPRSREGKEKAVELEVVARRLTREQLETRTDREKALTDELSVKRLTDEGFHTEAYDAIVENASSR